MKEESIMLLKLLSARFPNLVTFYKEVNPNIINKIEADLGNKLDESLKSIYKISDGISVLDYCIVGCNNEKILNIIDQNRLLRGLFPELENKFVGFMVTSTGDIFGYFTNFKNNIRPVGHINISNQNQMLIVASSVHTFLQIFASEVNNTIVSSSDRENLYAIEHNNWPRDLNYWFSKDVHLKDVYEQIHT